MTNYGFWLGVVSYNAVNLGLRSGCALVWNQSALRLSTEMLSIHMYYPVPQPVADFYPMHAQA